MGLDETTARLYATTDASVWAEEWCKVARDIEARGDSLIDEGWMIGWFANAMCVAEDHLRAKLDIMHAHPGRIHAHGGGDLNHAHADEDEEEEPW